MPFTNLVGTISFLVTALCPLYFLSALSSLCLCVSVVSSSLPAAEPQWFKPLTWRCIGPANMGGRITAAGRL